MGRLFPSFFPLSQVSDCSYLAPYWLKAMEVAKKAVMNRHDDGGRRFLMVMARHPLFLWPLRLFSRQYLEAWRPDTG